MLEHLGTDFCKTIRIPYCIELTKYTQTDICYARNIDLGSFFLFQPAAVMLSVISACIILSIIFFIKKKYTAIGQNEMAFFFWISIIVILIEALLHSNTVNAYTDGYSFLAFAHMAAVTTLFWALFYNGLLGFKIVIDGTGTSLWVLRLTSCALFLVVFFSVSILTRLENEMWTTAVVAAFLGINGFFILAYTVMECILVFSYADNCWSLMELFLALMSFGLGALVLFFSNTLCLQTKHYIDGSFLYSFFFLLGLMMLYKFWDSITKEEFEFFVDNDQNTWALEKIID
ncbi:MAG: chitin synthase export chaperone [Amphiamblys sp. WSBS2006]|nr:MAG: chitin synthase export chaperone [Amphiamblys sp. WSBS2006]